MFKKFQWFWNIFGKLEPSDISVNYVHRLAKNKQELDPEESYYSGEWKYFKELDEFTPQDGKISFNELIEIYLLDRSKVMYHKLCTYEHLAADREVFRIFGPDTPLKEISGKVETVTVNVLQLDLSSLSKRHRKYIVNYLTDYIPDQEGSASGRLHDLPVIFPGSPNL